MKFKKTSTQNKSQKTTRTLSKLLRFFFVFVIVLGGGMFLLNPQEASAANYYVDSSITDTNPASATPDFTTYDSTTFATTGGSDSVFKTIADINAFSALQPGDSVLFRKGQTWREQLIVPVSGTEGSVITFGAFGSGDKPVINGADLVTGWEQAILIGPELWDSAAAIFTSGTYSWIAQGSNTIANVTNELKVTYVNSADTARVALRDSADLSTDLTVSTTYRFQCDAYVGGGATQKIKVYDGTDYTLIPATGDVTTEKTTYTEDFTATSATGAYIGASSMDASDLFYFDNLSLKTYETSVTIYSKSGVTTEPMIVVYDGVLLTQNDGNYTTLGSNEWDWVSDVLYVRVGEDPDMGILEAGQRNYCLYSNNKDYVTYENLTLQYANRSGFRADNDDDNLIFDTVIAQYNGGGDTSSVGFGFEFDSSDPISMTNCDARYNGIAENGNAYGYMIKGSCGNIALTDCDASYNGNRGIQFDGGVSGTITITGGEVHHQANSYCDECDGIALDNTDAITINGVYIHDNKKGDNTQGDGIQISTGCVSPTIKYCYIKDNVQGIIINSPAGGSLLYNIISGTTNACIILEGNSANELNVYGNTLYDGGSLLLYLYNATFSATTNVKNNIIVADSDDTTAIELSSGLADTNINVNYNCIYDEGSGTMIDWGDNNYTQAQFFSYQSTESQDTNSISSDPLFTAPGSDDFTLQSTSPAIDTGTDLSLTTDYASNPIYGTPDIGAYEYQPPYTIRTNEIDTTGDIRIYADGKFRNTATAGGTTTDLSITPSGGFGSGDYSEWMNIDIDTWNTTGTYYKKWTETTSDLSLNSAHTVGDLSANTYYTVWYTKDGGSKTRLTTAQADGSSQITFTYDQGYSDVVFEIEEDTTSPIAFTLSSPSDNSLTNDNAPSLSWNASSDTESGLAKYHFI